jgi:truncated hemoglobin YjbI
MRSLYERIGGADTVSAMVDELYVRLTRDPRVRHYFDPARLDRLKAAQRRWFTSVLGGAPESDRPDLAAAHAHLDISDDQVSVVVHHLDESLATAGVDAAVRRQVTSLVARLWYARVF